MTCFTQEEGTSGNFKLLVMSFGNDFLLSNLISENIQMNNDKKSKNFDPKKFLEEAKA